MGQISMLQGPPEGTRKERQRKHGTQHNSHPGPGSRHGGRKEQKKPPRQWLKDKRAHLDSECEGKGK